MKEVYIHFHWISDSDIKYDIHKTIKVRCDSDGNVHYGDILFNLRQNYKFGKLIFPIPNENKPISF